MIDDVDAFVTTLRAGELFERGASIIVTRSPGRLDVMGGIADYSGSLVLQYPIAEATFVAIELIDRPVIEVTSIGRKPYMMPLDRTIVHATWGPGDIDCFGLAPAGTARQIDVSVDTPAEINLDAELLVDGKAIAIANKGGKGVVEKLTGIVPANARVVVRVKNPDASSNADVKYNVTIQEATATQDNAP